MYCICQTQGINMGIIFKITNSIVCLLITSPLFAAQEIAQPKDATSYTKQINAAILQQLPFNDKQDLLLPYRVEKLNYQMADLPGI